MLVLFSIILISTEVRIFSYTLTYLFRGFIHFFLLRFWLYLQKLFILWILTPLYKYCQYCLLVCPLHFFFFWLHSIAYGILVPQSGVEPDWQVKAAMKAWSESLAVKARSPDCWIVRKFPALIYVFVKKKLYLSVFSLILVQCPVFKYVFL